MGHTQYRNIAQVLIVWALRVPKDDPDVIFRVGAVFARLETKLGRYPSSAEVRRSM